MSKTILPLLYDPEMQKLLREHFWCDFSDIIPTMKWDDLKKKSAIPSEAEGSP
jgi:hypothetical protein